jgi:hypothetical protein
LQGLRALARRVYVEFDDRRSKRLVIKVLGE